MQVPKYQMVLRVSSRGLDRTSTALRTCREVLSVIIGYVDKKMVQIAKVPKVPK